MLTAATSPTLAAARPSLRNLPVNLFGAAMSLSGLALAWRLAHGSLGAPALIGELIGAFSLLVFVMVSAGYLVKFVRYPQAVHAEFRHPVAGNFFGTIAISILLLSAIISPYSSSAAAVVWAVGVVLAFALCFVAISRLLKGEVEASHAVPAWLVPGVATLDIVVTGGHMSATWAAEINLLACGVGAVLALLLIVMIVGRLVHRVPLAAAMRPSLMILVAPFAVGFLAYANVAGGIDRFAAMLFYFALFLFAVVAPKVFRPGSNFSPAWWAIGFPMAALANAALRYAEFRGSAPLWLLALLLLGALSAAMAVLTVQTVKIALNGKLLG